MNPFTPQLSLSFLLVALVFGVSLSSPPSILCLSFLFIVYGVILFSPSMSLLVAFALFGPISLFPPIFFFFYLYLYATSFSSLVSFEANTACMSVCVSVCLCVHATGCEPKLYKSSILRKLKRDLTVFV